MISDQELRAAVACYHKQRQTLSASHIAHVKAQKSFKEAIHCAALAIDTHHKIHPHQRRVGRRTLEALANQVATIEQELKAARNFDELYRLLEELNVPGIGALTVYDTALRIAHVRTGCLPDKIYLHTGTRAGARRVVPHLAGQAFIYKTDLPAVLKQSDLDCAELEDLLCHMMKPLFKECRKALLPDC